jgi:UDP-N-acetylglucosamine diphosphorylase / glucose-1-phosphate thymidylyltransferase / UDP-N-acetylgalactosamine diphosphorylase / glucosamine-1-phosphate N-acetyltransferase / galactosamine-1-phosphate N-acetyltransferase
MQGLKIKMQAVILAGGKGARLEPLTLEIPKAMIPIKGKPMIEIIIEQLKNTGTKEITIIVNYLKEKIIDYFEKNNQGIKINFAVQKEMNGDADALSYAEKYITQDKFITIACDSLFPTEHLEKLQKKECDGVLTVCEVEDARRFGVIMHENEEIKKIIEKSPNPPTNLANTSIYYLPKEIFSSIKKTEKDKTGEIRIVHAIQNMINEGKKFKFEIIKKWLDIGTHEQLEEAQKLVEEIGLCKQ